MIYNRTQNNHLLAEKIRVCDRFWTRLKGLLASPKLQSKEACWIQRCNSVHTFGMRYPIDVYFLDKTYRVVGISKKLKPNRLSQVFWKAKSVLEFSADSERSCCVGDQLHLENL